MLMGCREASGHTNSFSDPMVDCKESKLRYRADQLFWSRVEVHRVVVHENTSRHDPGAFVR